MTEVASPCHFSSLLEDDQYTRRYIAHCLPESRKELRSVPISTESSVILIGPEGDFTSGEINAAMAAGYQPVSLGDHRLRTETAAMVASVLLAI